LQKQQDLIQSKQQQQYGDLFKESDERKKLLRVPSSAKSPSQVLDQPPPNELDLERAEQDPQSQSSPQPENPLEQTENPVLADTNPIPPTPLPEKKSKKKKKKKVWYEQLQDEE